MGSMKDFSKTGRQVLKIILLILTVLLVYYLSTLVDRAQLREWKETAHPVPFFLSLTLLPLIGFPTTPFFLVAGGTYGVWIALLGTSLSLGLNLVLSFVITKSGLRPFLERILRKSTHQLPQVDPLHRMRYTILVRMVPALPNFAKNYLLCLVGIPFRIYFVFSMIISILYAAPIIVMGESIFDQEPLVLARALLVLLLLVGVKHWVSSD
jgi:uncharacterized membrane protein YdjX (TVP38/TMEM64 family)